ncbi:hypothetical protein [Streptomyces sp. NPDC001340]
MPNTNQPQQPTPLIETRVCIDDTFGPFDAKLDPTNRWNGWLSPYFTLDTVRELAARTQQMADEYGHDSVDTIHVFPVLHVVDGGTDREGEPRAVVVHIRWQYLDDGAESAATIVQPNDEGLYGIGGWEWTWHFATWPCPCDNNPWHETRCEFCGLHRPEVASADQTDDRA